MSRPDIAKGLFISQAPVFTAACHRDILQLLMSSGRVVDHTALIGRDKQTLSIEMNQLVDQLLTRYAKQGLSELQRVQLRQQVEATCVRVYELSRQIMRGDNKAADQFNELFKMI